MAARKHITTRQVASTVPARMKRHLPPHAQRIWAAAYRSALRQYGPSGGRPYAVANAAVERKYAGPGSKKWTAKSGGSSSAKSRTTRSHPAAKRGR